MTCRLMTMIEMLEKKPPMRVPGTAVFLTSDPETAPVSLMHSLKHYKVLHESNVILTVVTADIPRVADSERVEIAKLSDELFASDDDVRLYGRAQCAARAWPLPPARLEV